MPGSSTAATDRSAAHQLRARTLRAPFGLPSRVSATGTSRCPVSSAWRLARDPIAAPAATGRVPTFQDGVCDERVATRALRTGAWRRRLSLLPPDRRAAAQRVGKVARHQRVRAARAAQPRDRMHCLGSAQPIRKTRRVNLQAPSFDTELHLRHARGALGSIADMPSQAPRTPSDDALPHQTVFRRASRLSLWVGHLRRSPRCTSRIQNTADSRLPTQRHLLAHGAL
jgi:hypothetical protein